MPDMKSEPYPWTYHVLLTRAGTLPYSPNPLPMISKAISTHGSQTSSPVEVNVWPVLLSNMYVDVPNPEELELQLHMDKPG